MLKWKFLAVLACGAAMGAWATVWIGQKPIVVSAKQPALTALDYEEITQLTNRYAYGIDTCFNNGYDYADLFTSDGVFIDKNTDDGFRQGGRVLARGRDALATLVGGGSRGCKTRLIWTDWRHQPASVFRMGGPTIDRAMLTPLFVMVIGFMLHFAWALMLRMRTAILASRVRAARLGEVETPEPEPQPRRAAAGSVP